jgi:AraC-like DNA-binding protein
MILIFLRCNNWRTFEGAKEILSLHSSSQKINMLTKDSIYVILFSIPVYQLLFYTIQLISFKRRNPSKKYLGLLLLCMTTFLVINAIHFLGYDETFANLYLIYLPVLLSIAPAYFLYILSITQDNHDVDRKQRLILFSPAIFMLIASVVILGFMDQSSRLSMIRQGTLIKGSEAGEISAVVIGFWIFGILLVFAQIAFAITKVTKIMMIEAELMRKQPAHLAYLEWGWILGISISVLIFLVINAIIEMIVPMNHIGIVTVYNVLMLLSGGITGYLGMKQDTLLNQVEKISLKANEEIEDKDRPEKPEVKETITNQFISQEETEEIKKLIYQYLKTERPYINSDFSMHDLCNGLNISRRKISYVLNEVIEKNFYGVVNEFRIREAEELLMKDDLNQMKIEVLGEMVGFQSKSSFNACFKKVTGMTPSEFRLKKKV